MLAQQCIFRIERYVFVALLVILQPLLYTLELHHVFSDAVFASEN
jgi:hypothetical protein